MYNVYRKNYTWEMILKSIATNINGQLLLAAKIIFFFFLNAESLKFLRPTCGAQERNTIKPKTGYLLGAVEGTGPRAERNEHEIDPFSLRFIKCEKFLFIRDVLSLLKIVALYIFPRLLRYQHFNYFPL